MILVILKIYEVSHLVLWNNCMKIALAESVLPDEVEVFCQDLHRSLLLRVYSCVSLYSMNFLI